MDAHMNYGDSCDWANYVGCMVEALYKGKKDVAPVVLYGKVVGVSIPKSEKVSKNPRVMVTLDTENGFKAFYPANAVYCEYIADPSPEYLAGLAERIANPTMVV